MKFQTGLVSVAHPPSNGILLLVAHACLGAAVHAAGALLLLKDYYCSICAGGGCSPCCCGPHGPPSSVSKANVNTDYDVVYTTIAVGRWLFCPPLSRGSILYVFVSIVVNNNNIITPTG